MNLFTTEKTEIYFDPLAGLNLDSNLFELIDEINAFQVLNDIIIDVKNQVPMCEPDFSNSEVIPDINNHGYKFNLSFNVIGVENDKQLQFYGALFK